MALERAAWLERRFGAEISWMPYDLHPEYPEEGITAADLAARYGVHDLTEHTARFVRAEGLPVEMSDRIPNGAKALQLAELARDRDRFMGVHRSLFYAYWAKKRDIGEAEVLIDIGSAEGLDADDIEATLETRPYAGRIARSTQTATEIGVTGVPAWVVDDRFLVPGAQPEEAFERILTGLGHDSGGHEDSGESRR